MPPFDGIRKAFTTKISLINNRKSAESTLKNMADQGNITNYITDNGVTVQVNSFSFVH
jgi:hypothetical protein